jgi:hypothetical protein
MPPIGKIKEVIETTPGIDEVHYKFTEGGRSLTSTGIKPPSQVYNFWYRGGTNVHGSLRFIVDYKGTVDYSQSLVEMDSRPPQKWVDATRPVMIAIEARLERECGLTNLSASVTEWHRGVK